MHLNRRVTFTNKINAKFNYRVSTLLQCYQNRVIHILKYPWTTSITSVNAWNVKNRQVFLLDNKIKFRKLHWLQDFAATKLNFLNQKSKTFKILAAKSCNQCNFQHLILFSRKKFRRLKAVPDFTLSITIDVPLLPVVDLDRKWDLPFDWLCKDLMSKVIRNPHGYWVWHFPNRQQKSVYFSFVEQKTDV